MEALRTPVAPVMEGWICTVSLEQNMVMLILVERSEVEEARINTLVQCSPRGGPGRSARAAGAGEVQVTATTP